MEDNEGDRAGRGAVLVLEQLKEKQRQEEAQEEHQLQQRQHEEQEQQEEQEEKVEETAKETMVAEEAGKSDVRIGKGNDAPPHKVGGYVVVVAAMVCSALVANWFARVWFDWLTSQWTLREIPMLFITLTVNAVVKGAEEKNHKDKDEKKLTASEVQPVPDDENESENQIENVNEHENQIESVNENENENENVNENAIENENGNETQNQETTRRRRRRRKKSVRALLFESLCAYRLIVGFPPWHIVMEIITFFSVTEFGFKEHFGFRFLLLTSVYCAFKYRELVLHTMIPVFLVYNVWLVGGQAVADVATFPLDILWRVVDLGFVLFTGSSVVRGVFFRSLTIGAGSLGVNLFWMLPSPICYDKYYESYRAAIPSFGRTPVELGESQGYLNPSTRSCLGECFAEMAVMVGSGRGITKIVCFVLLASILYKLNVHGLLLRWLRERERALDDVERVFANRKKVLEYAKQNPFRAKLHADPSKFLATTQQQQDHEQQEQQQEQEQEQERSPSSFAASLSRWKPKDLGIKSSLMRISNGWNPSTSLHSRLGERAKSTTYVDRIHALQEGLKKLHGVPDTYDLLFRKATVVIDRNVEKNKRCVFFQVSDQLIGYSINTVKNGFNVTFTGEDGVDAGGLSAEMYNIITEELVNSVDENTSNTEKESFRYPRLLRALPDSTLMLAPNPDVDLEHYYALGRLIGLAILKDSCLKLPLSSAMLKMMIDIEIDSEDVRALDPTYFENRMLTLLQPGGVELMKSVMDIEEIPFVWIDSNGEFGQELCSRGADIMLSEENKLEYVQLLSEHYVCGDVREQMTIFLSGFHEVIPITLLQQYDIDYIDLALALQGVLEIDVENWREFTVEPVDNTSWTLSHLADGSSSSQVVSTKMMLDWFWECVSEMDSEKRTRLLQFSTGLSSAPVGGFRNLKPRFFNIVIDSNPEHLPSAVTCFATLRIPICATKQVLANKLYLICSQRHLTETFGEK